MKTAILIPARGGSKGIPRKNIIDLNGKPLIAYSVEAAVKANVGDVWVSSDDQEILIIAKEYGAQALLRPEHLATDTANTESVMLHFADVHDYETIVLFQPTSPLTLAEDVTGICEFIGPYDSAISVCEDRGGWLCGGFKWFEGGVPDYDLFRRPRRQDEWTKVYRENGALYAIKTELLLESKCRLGGDIGLYVMPRQRSFEIDSPEDLEEIRIWLKAREVKDA